MHVREEQQLQTFHKSSTSTQHMQCRYNAAHAMRVTMATCNAHAHRVALAWPIRRARSLLLTTCYLLLTTAMFRHHGPLEELEAVALGREAGGERREGALRQAQVLGTYLRLQACALQDVAATVAGCRCDGCSIVMLRVQGSAGVGQADARSPCMCMFNVNVHVSAEPGAYIIYRPSQVHI